MIIQSEIWIWAGIGTEYIRVGVYLHWSSNLDVVAEGRLMFINSEVTLRMECFKKMKEGLSLEVGQLLWSHDQTVQLQWDVLDNAAKELRRAFQNSWTICYFWDINTIYKQNVCQLWCCKFKLLTYNYTLHCSVSMYHPSQC